MRIRIARLVALVCLAVAAITVPVSAFATDVDDDDVSVTVEITPRATESPAPSPTPSPTPSTTSSPTSSPTPSPSPSDTKPPGPIAETGQVWPLAAFAGAGVAIAGGVLILVVRRNSRQPTA